jgi:aspartyl-tRNA(Asn)/glutamyl-tRNA(Gln) amidotransferase subunit A
VPANFGLDGLDPAVEKGFMAALARLEAAGFALEERTLEVLEDYKTLPVWQFAAAECHAHCAGMIRDEPELFDPRVISRMRRAEGLSAIEYCQTLERRAELIRRFAEELGDGTLLLPTVAIAPPRFTELEDDEAYYRLNVAVLRNPSLANVMDGCSLSLPLRAEAVPLGLMLTKRGGMDRQILAEGAAIQELLGESA